MSSDSLSAVVAMLRAAGCVFAEDEAELLAAEARTPADLSAMVRRRVAGLPLEQVLGWAEFCGLRITVEPGVFVPRRRTEFLAHEAASRAAEVAVRARERAHSGGPAAGPARPTGGPARPGAGSVVVDGPVVVDLCCGSGAVGAAVAAAAGRVELHAADIDPAAVRCARRNLADIGGRVYQGDLFEPLPATLWGRVDVLVANAPYVPTRDVALLPAEARMHEPRVALDGGADGLHILRRVAAAAPRWLAHGGHLLVETSERQAPPIAAVMTCSGLSAWVAVCDELDTAVVIAMKPPRHRGDADGGELPPRPLMPGPLTTAWDPVIDVTASEPGAGPAATGRGGTRTKRRAARNWPPRRRRWPGCSASVSLATWKNPSRWSGFACLRPGSPHPRRWPASAPGPPTTGPPTPTGSPTAT